MTPPPKPTSLETLYAQAQEDPFYLANPQLLDTVCFDTGVKGEHLVIKSTIDNEVPTPASVTFFGEVSRSFCQVSPYGSYNPERNPFNISGVAFDASINAYRVFGCSGSVPDDGKDVIIFEEDGY